MLATMYARVLGESSIGRRQRRGKMKARCPPHPRAHGYKYELQRPLAARRTDLGRLVGLGYEYAKTGSAPRPRIALFPHPPASSPFASSNGLRPRGVSLPKAMASSAVIL